ncbi:hypothetical protein ACRRTK_006260 [Alexandromys fortis]
MVQTCTATLEINVAVSQKIEKLQDPAIPLLGIYPKDALPYHRDTCSTVLIAALLIITRPWKQPRCPSAEEWIKKMYTYTMGHYSAVKNNNTMKFAGNGWN